MNELGIDPAREQGMMLKQRAEAFKVKPGYIGQEKHGVRVAYGEAGHFPASAVHAQGTADEILALRKREVQGDFRGEPFRLAHIHRDHVRVFRNFKPSYARPGFHRRIRPGDQPARQGIASHAAYAVAAHFRFTAVAVEHAHSDIRDGRGQNEDEAIRADATMTIADRGCQPFQGGVPGGQGGGEAVHVDIVVAEAVHFDEVHHGSRSVGLVWGGS